MARLLFSSPKNPFRVICSLFLAALAVFPMACSDSAGPEPAGELTWIQTHAVPLSNSNPFSPEPNLSALRNFIGDARIVGLGEGTHGTTEFWGMRQKITRYLVEEMGFTAVLMEAGFPNSLYLDRYVTRGEGTLLEAHQKLRVWRYQEMRKLIDWMRQHNLDHASEGDTLHYLGYDCAFRDWDEAIELIEEYLLIVDPASAPEVVGRLENHTLEDAQWAEDRFESLADEYIAAGGHYEYDLHFRIIQNLAPSWTVWSNLMNDRPTYDLRDGFNQKNVNWIIEEMLDGGKVVIWAHNSHVGNILLPDGEDTTARMLGYRLRGQHGPDYYVMATEFYGGAFLAWDDCPGNTLQLVTHQAALPLEDTYAYRFHAGGVPLFMLDLRGVDYSQAEAAWLMGPLLMRRIGASYCQANDRDYTRMLSLPTEFDGVIFFDGTGPTTPVGF